MSKRLLDFNPVTGEAVSLQFEGGSMRVVHEQDTKSILDANKRLANNDSLTRKGIKNDMLHYATIPNTLIVKWKQENGVDIFNPDHRGKMFRLLNHPDYKYLKTTTITHAE
jgi:hypothetical protein